MKFILLFVLLFTGCTQNVKQEDIQELKSSIIKINARLDGIDNDIDAIKSYLNNRYEASKDRAKHRREFEKHVTDQLQLHESRINNMLPIYNHK